MSIKMFESIVLPPRNPAEVPDAVTWSSVQMNLTKFPNDYKAFIQLYGTGCIDAFIWIYNPASKNPNLNLEQQVVSQKTTLKEVNESEVETFIPLFPSPHGVLPFGITDNGDVLFWETYRNPNSWTVAVLAARSSPLLRFDMNMTSFLAGVCDGSIICEAFPKDFPSLKPHFAAC